MWKIKNKEAVSPVIGVILMVAITVVLAAVLYVWVSGFMGAGGGGAPTAAFGNMASVSTGSYVNKTSVTKISASIDDASCKWQLKDSAGLTKQNGLFALETSFAGTGMFGWIDNDGDSRLSTGDLLYINTTTTGETITVGWQLVIFDTSGNQIGYANYV